MVVNLELNAVELGKLLDNDAIENLALQKAKPIIGVWNLSKFSITSMKNGVVKLEATIEPDDFDDDDDDGWDYGDDDDEED